MLNKFISIFLLLIFSSTMFSQNNQQENKMDIKIQTPAFKDGGNIPSKYTCDDANISPRLTWSTKAEGIKTYAIIVNDPDAPSGDFVHWVLYNIPSNIKELAEDITPSKNIPEEILMGTNGAGKIGYMGPCPPSGTHRYYFRIYGLNSALHLSPGAEKWQLVKAMEGHIVAQGELMGKYKRNK